MMRKNPNKILFSATAFRRFLRLEIKDTKYIEDPVQRDVTLKTLVTVLNHFDALANVKVDGPALVAQREPGTQSRLALRGGCLTSLLEANHICLFSFPIFNTIQHLFVKIKRTKQIFTKILISVIFFMINLPFELQFIIQIIF